MFTKNIILDAPPKNNGRRLKRETLVLQSNAVEDLAAYDPNAEESFTIYRDSVVKLPHKSKAKIYKRKSKHKENFNV